MTNNLVILRNRKGVKGIGNRLSKALDLYQVTAGSHPNVKIPENGYVLNYGVGRHTVWDRPDINYINHSDAVVRSVDKITCLTMLHEAGVPCIDFTTNSDDLPAWFADGHSVLVRATATGRQGRGISLIDPSTFGTDVPEIPEAPLYTKHYEKTHEFRVHVFNGQVIDLVQKKRMGKKKLAKRGLTQADELLRNHKRGWVFTRKDIYDFPELREYAIATCHTLGLTYGGIDMLAKINEDTGELIDAVVCESNSAPGMTSPTTFQAYINAINNYVN